MGVFVFPSRSFNPQGFYFKLLLLECSTVPQSQRGEKGKKGLVILLSCMNSIDHITVSVSIVNCLNLSNCNVI